LASYLNLVNAVLVRLRESSVTTIPSTGYAALIGKLVNDAKREVEAAYDWSALRTEIDVTTAAGTEEYSITGSNQRTRIKGVYNVTADNYYALRRITDDQYLRYSDFGSIGNQQPSWWRIRGADSSQQLKLNLFPIPDAAYTIRIDCVNPQAALASDSTELSIPSEPVEALAWAKAISERGEDQGVLFDESMQWYRAALADAIGAEQTYYQGDMDFRVL